MEFLEGVTLADKLRQSGPLPWQEAEKIFLEICDGLQTIHQAGIIHRDLKSRNIMLASRNGSSCTVLMDFGLAHEIATPDSSDATSLTRVGTILGTPDYMAPEQFEGKTLTPATDIYALGIVLYELVTGKHPFAASTPIGAAVVRGRRPILASSLCPGLPRRFDEVIGACLEFDPERRYQSAKRVAEELQGHLLLIGWFRRKRAAIVSAAATLLLVASSLLMIPATRDRLRGILFSTQQKHIAVLPFDLTGDDPETIALGDGLMDSLAGRLSNFSSTNQSLWVVPASEVRKRKVNSPTSALHEFGATIVVQGRFERKDRAAHLNLTLIDTRKMREIGFADVENETGDLAALQDEAVTRLSRLMNVTVSENVAGAAAQPSVHAAYEDYLLALGYIQRFDKPGNLDLAISSLKRAVQTDPHFALGFAKLAQVYVLKYNLDKNPQWLQDAQKYCSQALQLDQRVPLAHVALAQIARRTGNSELADAEYQHAIDLDPRDASALTGKAALDQERGNTSDAEKGYIKAAALRPDDWSGYNNLGNFYNQIGRPRDAITQFSHAIQLAPDNSGLYANLGEAYMNTGDPKMETAAEKAFIKSISIHPTYMAYANLGNLYGIQHHFSESVTESKKALQLNDKDYIVWSNLAQGYEWLGDEAHAAAANKKTMELVEQAIKLNPQDADAQATEAMLLAKEGAKDDALDKIRISLALSPNSQSVLTDVADAYELMGERQLAIQCLEHAIHNGLPLQQLKTDPYIKNVVASHNFDFAAK